MKFHAWIKKRLALATALKHYGGFHFGRGSKIHRAATIEGPKDTIKIGEGTELEPGVVLSTKFGGSITIGKDCCIRRGAMILSYGGHILIGDYCGVNLYSILYGHGGLSVGNYVQFAAHCVVIPANHGIEAIDTPIWKQPLSKKGISIDDDVWIGANSSILDGVHIGRGAVIGAGTVVTKSIEPYSVNVGNPAQQISNR